MRAGARPDGADLAKERLMQSLLEFSNLQDSWKQQLEAVPRGIARISGLEINRRFCRGAFHDLLDEESDELMRFSLALFDANGMLKNEFTNDDYHKGSGCFGRELNQGLIFYLDTVEVDKEVRPLFC